jgi:CRP/FNR family transcriptional regulator
MMAAKEKFIRANPKCASRDFLKELPLFANLPDKEVQLFADAAHIKSYKKGQYLYMEGEEAVHFYVICSGWLKLLHVTEDGEEIVLAMLTRNNITGESAIFEHDHFASTAQIVEDAQIVSLPIGLLKEQMSISNKLALNMLTSMIQYQRRHEMQVEQFLLYSAPQRVGCFILGLCPVQEQKDGAEIELPYDKTLIANTLGMKGPTFSRALNILREKTGTRISGSHVTIDSIKQLLEFVNGCYLPHHLRKE